MRVWPFLVSVSTDSANGVARIIQDNPCTRSGKTLVGKPGLVRNPLPAPFSQLKSNKAVMLFPPLV